MNKFRKQLLSWNEQDRNGYFFVCKTPKILKKIGIVQNKIIIGKKKLLNILENHKEISKIFLLHLNDYISNPMIIIKSQNIKYTDKRIIIVPVKIINNKPCLIIVELKPIGLDDDTIIISSIYTKDRIDVFNRWIKANNTLYINNMYKEWINKLK